MNLRVHFGRPMFGKDELKAVEFILRKRKLTCAGQVRAFEEQFEQFVGGGQAVAVTSCMAALHLAYLVKGIGPGDEVIVPALTHPATVNAVELVGATPVFVDCHIESGNMDPDLISVTPRTRALSVVHFLGHPAYMRSTVDIARRHGLYVVEDCALALGTVHGMSNSHVGLIGDVGTFSFYPVKHITTGEGGMLLTRHPELASNARKWRSFCIDHGEDREDDDVLGPGLNYRMTEMQGIIGQEQLKKLPIFLERRRANAKLLRELLRERDYLAVGGDYALSVLLPPDAPERRVVRRRMLVERVETSVYYARPVCDYTYYKEKYGYAEVPNARFYANRTIALSVGPHLNSDDIRLTAEVFFQAVEKG